VRVRRVGPRSTRGVEPFAKPNAFIDDTRWVSAEPVIGRAFARPVGSARPTGSAKPGAEPLRVKINFLNNFRLIWVVQSFEKKFTACDLTQISCMSATVSPTEGRIAIVTNAGGDAVDAASVARARGLQGGLLFVSDHLARKTNDADADGEDVWSWRLKCWRQVSWRLVRLNRVGQACDLRGDGGKRA
jgi:hypothetical protein